MLQTHDLPYQIRIGRKRNSCVSLVQKFPFRRAVQFQNVREYLGQINVYNSTLAAEANGYMVYKGKSRSWYILLCGWAHTSGGFLRAAKVATGKKNP